MLNTFCRLTLIVAAAIVAIIVVGVLLKVVIFAAVVAAFVLAIMTLANIVRRRNRASGSGVLPGASLRKL